MNVLVYSGPEIIQSSLENAISTLQSLLTPNYTVQKISLQSLQSHPWATNCALLVFPQCQHIVQSPATSAIISYIQSGGSFLGLGFGIRCIADQWVPGMPKDLSLRFFDNVSRMYIYPTANGPSTSSQSVTLQTQEGRSIRDVRENGIKRDFEHVEKVDNIKVLLKYSADGGIAGIQYDFLRGKIILWGPNIEDPASTEGLHLLKDTLEIFGLHLPTSPDLDKARVQARPLPQFLTSSPRKPWIISKVTDALATAAADNSSALTVFDDTNDTFHFHSLSETAASDIQPSEKDRHIVICADGKLPSREQTPLFDISAFFDALDSNATGQKDRASGTWRFGDALLYGEMVTSTQTMLDKNPRLLSALPTPFLSLASHQLAGRGRGSNVWLSPSGCLQYSLVLRVSTLATSTTLPYLPANKLVFIQYLFALAIVEACRDDSVLGPKWGQCTRIKWPNDLYAVGSEGERKKIGGILVNTSFSGGGKVDIVIGSGLNVLNAPPITSLLQLTPELKERPLSMERTAAAIMARFEPMWDTFLRGGGSFEPFMELYLERWLHSDQLVTLETTTPPTKVRIVGITVDHGLLRTVRERTGWGGSAEDGFIDLQPDGNSFDLMAGLIRSKS